MAVVKTKNHYVHHKGQFETPPPPCMIKKKLSIHPKVTAIQHGMQKIYLSAHFFNT